MLDAAELLQGRWIWRETWRWVVAAERRLELHWIGVECAVREWKACGLQVEAVSHTVLVHWELWESLQAAAAHLMMFWSEQQRGTGKMSKVWLAVSSLPSSSEAPFCDSLGMRVAAHSRTAYKLTWCWWGEPNSYLIPPVCQAGHRLCPSSSLVPAVRTGKPVALIEKVVSLPSVHGGRRKNVGKQWDKNSEITCCHFCLYFEVTWTCPSVPRLASFPGFGFNKAQGKKTNPWWHKTTWKPEMNCSEQTGDPCPITAWLGVWNIPSNMLVTACRAVAEQWPFAARGWAALRAHSWLPAFRGASLTLH